MKRVLGLLLALVLTLAMAVPASAAVWTDQADYAPGSAVTIHGNTSYIPGETVHIDVVGPHNYSQDVIADASGAWSYTFTLAADLSAVGTYTYTATGLNSGTTENGTFTDAANYDTSTTLNAITTPLTAGQTGVSFSGQVTVSGSDPAVPDGVTVNLEYRLVSSGPYATLVSTTTHTTAGVHGLFSGTFTAPAAESYLFRASFPVYHVDGPSGGTNWRASASADSGHGQTIVVNAAPSNHAPTVSATNATVTVNEGSSASNSGSYNDVDSGDTVTVTASVGGITGDGAQSGTWSWSYTPPDGPASSTVTITATDNHGASNQTTFSLVVNNVAPTVAADNAAVTVDEGQTATNTGTYSDPGADTVAITASVGSISAGGSQSGTWSWSFATTDGPAQSQTVTVTATDSDGAPNTTTFALTVTNVAPTATFNAPASVDEGSSINISLTSPVDPSSDDTAAGFTYAFDFGAGYGSFSSTSTALITPDDGPATVNVGGKIKDKDGGVSEYKTRVTVNNVAPTATFNTPSSAVDEGSSFTISLINPSDPSTADTTAGFTYAFDLGLGAGYSAFSSTSSASGTPPDGPKTLAVKGKIKDKDGGVTEYTGSVTVNNVAPTVTASTDQTADEGTSTSFALGSFSDPGISDNPWAVDVDWGDTTSHTTFNRATQGAITAQSHTYADNGNYTVTVKVTDRDGGNNSATFKITVANVTPANVKAAPASAMVNENGTIILMGSFTDPGTLDTHTVVISWGDGSANTQLNLAAQVLSFSTTHQYLDDNPTNTAFDTNAIGVTVTDKDNASGSGSTSIVVRNVPPVVGAITAPLDPVKVGMPVGASASFTDVGTQDTHTALWDWEGSTSGGTVAEANGSGSVTGSKIYTVAGIYTIKLTVTDDDTGVGNIPAYNYVVVYDPSAGFVTGGGWIMSPPGADRRPGNALLTGKANFGFVSKYLKGANTPTGNTEFQFHEGNLNFSSTSYDWLVVAGTKAMYKGEGTVNGTGNYGFLLSAIDGGKTDPDKFRIKIWDKNNNDTVVYDNLLGTKTDDAEPTTVIGGGNIVIQTGGPNK